MKIIDRREWLRQAGCGFGSLGLMGLLHQQGLMGIGQAADIVQSNSVHMADPLLPRKPHMEAKATRVIWIFANGGPSHVDTWDYKPGLTKWNGKSIREFDSGFKDTTGFFKNAVGNLMHSPFKFTARGKCGKMYGANGLPVCGILGNLRTWK